MIPTFGHWMAVSKQSSPLYDFESMYFVYNLKRNRNGLKFDRQTCWAYLDPPYRSPSNACLAPAIAPQTTQPNYS